jgi:hypothetical protein
VTDEQAAGGADQEYRQKLRDEIEDHVLRTTVVATVLHREGPKGVTPDALQNFVKGGIPVYPCHGIYAAGLGFFLGARAMKLEAEDAIMFGAEVAFGVYQRLGQPAERAETVVHESLDRLIAALEDLHDKAEAGQDQGALDDDQACALFTQVVASRMISSLTGKEQDAFHPTDEEVKEFARLVVVA